MEGYTAIQTTRFKFIGNLKLTLIRYVIESKLTIEIFIKMQSKWKNKTFLKDIQYCKCTFYPDSLAHLNTSLDELVKNLKSDEEAMKPIRDFLEAEYGAVDPVKYDLLLRKGVRISGTILE